jgi:membrane protease YdiL (CAAX protease family)
MGFILLTALLLVLRGVSGFRFGPAGSTGLESFEFGLLYAAVFGAVSLAEETMWRGYALVCLSRALSFWPAAIVLGAIFGAVHLNHSTENYLGISAAALFGLVFAWSFRCTGSLWFALGVHAGWDYSQSFIYGVPDSGVVLPGALLRPHMGGPAWLTGGSAGPEGSVLMAAVLACVVLCVRFVRTTE